MSWQEIADWARHLDTLKQWSPYIGTFTGLAGLIVGIAAYIRSGRSRALDLRLEIHKAENATRALLDELPALIDHANSSRTSINIATGHLNTADQLRWNQTCQMDRSKVAALWGQLPERGVDYRRLPSEELEAALVAIDEVRVKAGRLREKYRGSMSADDRVRGRCATPASPRRMP